MAIGRKTGGGSRKGRPNKSTVDVKTLAGKYTDAAMAELGRLAIHAESEPARVAAIKELLDRAYGRAPQSVEVAPGAAGSFTVTWLPPA